MVKEESKSFFPFVSIIIPVYNAEKYIKKTLNALENQSYPRDKFEIIIIDNGSNDSTLKLLEGENYLILHNEQAKNPYISRNIGVSRARGEVIVFLDITCMPANQWLKEGGNLIKNGADLVGGHIAFAINNRSTLGEWYDAITFLNVQEYVEHNKGTVCGNLFVKQKIWNIIGPFPETSRSGMDMYWTRKATAKGFKLVYGKQAIVEKKPRCLKGVLKKSYRVGKGHIISWSRENNSKKFMWWETFKTFSPPSIKDVRKKINQRGKPEMNNYIPQLWLISWINKIAMALGRTASLINKN